MNKLEDGPSSRVIDTLREGLEYLSYGHKLRDQPTEFVHKNDRGYGVTLSRISEGDVISNNLRVGLIVGNGAVLSSLPRIPADLVIVVDRNKFILHWALDTAQVLSTTNSPTDYRKSVYEDRNSLYNRRFNWWHPIARMSAGVDIGMEQGDLREKHFLSSQERFEECKVALLRKPLLTAAVDLANQSGVSRLGQLIRQSGGEISFANFTNVWEHAGQVLEHTLPLLPFHKDAVILHSSSAYEFGDILPRTMGIQKGLPAYIRSVTQNPRWVTRMA